MSLNGTRPNAAWASVARSPEWRGGHSRAGGLIIMALAMTVWSLPADSWGKEAGLWERYKGTFIAGDGRVVDFHQEEISHSEGQGYSMLLALDYDDRETFEKLWNWTRGNLAVRSDGLLAWRWGKRITGAWGVIDYNNATDGDILVAMALMKAGAKWGNRDLADAGLALSRAIRKNLVVEVGPWSCLLPGYFGFEFDGGFALNPSYMIPTAFELFARTDDEGKTAWRHIHKGALRLVKESGFGQMKLPADWVAVDRQGNIQPHWGKSRYSGKEAVRVFLYSSFDGSVKHVPGLDVMLGLHRKFGYIPAQVNLLSSEVSMEPAPAGFYAVYGKSAAAVGKNGIAEKLFREARAALDKEDRNYYSFVLYLLATSEEAL